MSGGDRGLADHLVIEKEEGGRVGVGKADFVRVLDGEGKGEAEIQVDAEVREVERDPEVLEIHGIDGGHRSFGLEDGET